MITGSGQLNATMSLKIKACKFNKTDENNHSVCVLYIDVLGLFVICILSDPVHRKGYGLNTTSISSNLFSF